MDDRDSHQEVACQSDSDHEGQPRRDEEHPRNGDDPPTKWKHRPPMPHYPCLAHPGMPSLRPKGGNPRETGKEAKESQRAKAEKVKRKAKAGKGNRKVSKGGKDQKVVPRHEVQTQHKTEERVSGPIVRHCVRRPRKPKMNIEIEQPTKVDMRILRRKGNP